MKKYLLFLLSLIICTASVNSVLAAKYSTSNSQLAQAIRLYKTHDYAQCYLTLSNIVQKDSSNAAAYYYLAMTSAQLGRKQEAIDNYSKVLTLNPGTKLTMYAEKGKRCLETPDKCHDDSAESKDDLFIRGKFGSGFTNEVRSDFEKRKIENLMREMNRKDDIAPSRFKDYKDFSSEAPTNDEIVAAMRVLQKAGFTNYSDLSLIGGNQNNNLTDFLGINNGSNINPQLIQALLTSQMSAGF